MLSSDVMSSSPYAIEEMLRILVPIAGLAAFSIVTPMTAAILAVLAVVTICYRDVVRSYPKAGGSYVVSRDNLGPNVAHLAGVPEANGTLWVRAARSSARSSSPRHPGRPAGREHGHPGTRSLTGHQRGYGVAAGHGGQEVRMPR